MNCTFCRNALFVFLATILLANNCFAQTPSTALNGKDNINTVFTAIPFLRINPDARTGGMGDVGIATSPDAGSMYHNASKLAFAENDLGLSITYTPWLRELVDDIFIAHLAGYKRIDDLQTMGLSLRYFSLGNILFTDITGAEAGEYNPNEFAIDLAYARRLSDRFSAGITLKYVRSDLAKGQEVGSGNIVKAANAVAADISFFYTKDLPVFGRDSKITFGTAITNIGNKVSYTEDDVKDFIPINLGLGSALEMNFDEHNSLMFTVDINKLMVPTPDSTNDARSKPLLSGMFGSFGDAPGGFKEEMRELMYAFGMEYWYNKQFGVRFGHFNEHATKGNRKFISAGIGLKYSVFGLNFAYVKGVSQQNHPLDNTLRFSLSFDFDGKKNKDIDENDL